MTRTKEAARKENFKKRPIDHKRKSEIGPPPAKKVKKNPPSSTVINTSTSNVPQSLPTNSSYAPTTSQTHHAAPTEPSLSTLDLENTHEVTSMSIISSSHIQQKVSRALDVLSVYPTPANEKPRLLKMHAKAGCAVKMISIAEITKREIGKEGKWFQYNMVEGLMGEVKRLDKDKLNRKEKGEKAKAGGEEKDGENNVDAEDGEHSEEESTAFETMKTPFERANEGKAKVRAVPLMTLYLSRVRIDGLRKIYGEQTNALPPQKEKD